MSEEKSKSKRRKAIQWNVLIIVVLIGAAIAIWHHNSQPPHPTDLVEFWEGWESPVSERNEMNGYYGELGDIFILEGSFTSKPYRNTLDYIFENINQDRTPKEKFSYQIEESKELQEIKISINFQHFVSALDALYDVTTLIGKKFQIDPGRIVKIYPGNFTIDLITRKFPCPKSVFPSHSGYGPISLTKELEEAGVIFLSDCKADYYPKRNLLVVSNSPDQMGLIDLFLNPAKQDTPNDPFTPLWPK